VQVPPLGWNSTVFCGGGRFVDEELDEEEEPLPSVNVPI
jgi:hypothetical protein